MSEVPAAAPAPPPPPEGGPAAEASAVSYATAPPIGPAYSSEFTAAAPPGTLMGVPAPAGGGVTAGVVPPGVGDAPPPPYDGTAASPSIDAPTLLPAVVATPRRRFRWLWWTAGSLVFASLAGLSAYLVVVSQQWSERVDDLTAISGDLGAQVAEQNEARKAAEDEANTLQSQLDTATARVTELVNEEANANDREEMWIALIDNMISCEEGWAGHATVLKGQQRYTDTTTAAAEADLVAYCEGVKTDFAELKAEIGK